MRKTKIFGIENVSDIQRFRYYPGTKSIYTFIGFKNALKSSIGQIIQNSKLKNETKEKVMLYNINETDTKIVLKDSDQAQRVSRNQNPKSYFNINII